MWYSSKPSCANSPFPNIICSEDIPVPRPYQVSNHNVRMRGLLNNSLVRVAGLAGSLSRVKAALYNRVLPMVAPLRLRCGHIGLLRVLLTEPRHVHLRHQPLVQPLADTHLRRHLVLAVALRVVRLVLTVGIEDVMDRPVLLRLPDDGHVNRHVPAVPGHLPRARLEHDSLTVVLKHSQTDVALPGQRLGETPVLPPQHGGLVADHPAPGDNDEGAGGRLALRMLVV